MMVEQLVYVGDGRGSYAAPTVESPPGYQLLNKKFVGRLVYNVTIGAILACLLCGTVLMVPFLASLVNSSMSSRGLRGPVEHIKATQRGRPIEEVLLGSAPESDGASMVVHPTASL